MNLRIGRSYGSANTILLTDTDKHDYIAQLNLKGQLMNSLSDEEKQLLMKAVYEKLQVIIDSKKTIVLSLKE